MALEVKQGRNIGIFLKDNIPTDKASFVEREVFVTIQGSKSGKEAKVKLKINAGRRHPVIQSPTGAVTLNESGQIVETFNPNQLPEELEELEEIEKIIDKVEQFEKDEIVKVRDAIDDSGPLIEKIEEIAGTGIKPGQFSGMVDEDAIKNLAESGALSNLGNIGNLGNLNISPGIPERGGDSASGPKGAVTEIASGKLTPKQAALKKKEALVAKLTGKGVGKSFGKRGPTRKTTPGDGV